MSIFLTVYKILIQNIIKHGKYIYIEANIFTYILNKIIENNTFSLGI